MRGAAEHAATVMGNALVGDHRPHHGRLADDAALDRQLSLLQVGNQAPDAQTTDFLVVRQRDTDGALQLAGCGQPCPLLDQGQHARDEALHVATAATIETTLALAHDERVALPALAVDRHHVGVPGQHHDRQRRIPDHRKQVGLVAGIGKSQRAVHAKLRQIVLHPPDQGQVGLTTGGVKSDQLGEDGLHGAIRGS
ncbi:hypothetical protein D3C72_1623690 [compost metagenome]